MYRIEFRSTKLACLYDWFRMHGLDPNSEHGLGWRSAEAMGALTYDRDTGLFVAQIWSDHPLTVN